MEAMMIIFVLIYVISFFCFTILFFVDLICFLICGERKLGQWILGIDGFILIMGSSLLFFCDGYKEIGEMALFPKVQHIYLLSLMVASTIAWWSSSYRTKTASPVLNTFLNCLMLMGIGLNIFVANRTDGGWLLIGGGLMNLVWMYALISNHQLILSHTIEGRGGRRITRMCRNISHARLFTKVPVLLVLCLPLLLLADAVVLLTGKCTGP